MKYKIGDKVKIVRCNGTFKSQYLNMTGKIVDNFGKLNLVKLDYNGSRLIMIDEQLKLIKIKKD